MWLYIGRCVGYAGCRESAVGWQVLPLEMLGYLELQGPWVAIQKYCVRIPETRSHVCRFTGTSHHQHEQTICSVDMSVTEGRPTTKSRWMHFVPRLSDGAVRHLRLQSKIHSQYRMLPPALDVGCRSHVSGACRFGSNSVHVTKIQSCGFT